MKYTFEDFEILVLLWFELVYIDCCVDFYLMFT